MHIPKGKTWNPEWDKWQEKSGCWYDFSGKLINQCDRSDEPERFIDRPLPSWLVEMNKNKPTDPQQQQQVTKHPSVHSVQKDYSALIITGFGVLAVMLFVMLRKK